MLHIFKAILKNRWLLRSKSGSRPTMRRNPELVWSWSWFSFSQLVLGVIFCFFQVKKARGPILSKVLLATFVSERRVTIRHSFSFEQWKHKALQLYAVMLASWLVCVVVWCPWATQWTRNVSTRPGGMGWIQTQVFAAVHSQIAGPKLQVYIGTKKFWRISLETHFAFNRDH